MSRTLDTAPKGINWEAQPLGQVPDRQLAMELGVRTGTVRSARVVRGIDAWVPPDGAREALRAPVDWSKVTDLGRVPDSVVAQRLGVHLDLVGAARRRRGVPALLERPKRGIDWDEQPLGREHDEEIARRLGVNPSTVRQARIARGIPPQDRAIDWPSVPDLGLVPDKVIAARLGRSVSSVRAARARRGIPPWRRWRT